MSTDVRDYEYLDAKALINILPVGKDTVYKMMALESFPSVRLGRRYVVRRDKFEEWWEENEGRELVL